MLALFSGKVTLAVKLRVGQPDTNYFRAAVAHISKQYSFGQTFTLVLRCHEGPCFEPTPENSDGVCRRHGIGDYPPLRCALQERYAGEPRTGYQQQAHQ